MAWPSVFKYQQTERNLDRVKDALWGPGDGENTAHILFGAGTNADPVEWTTANKIGIDLRLKSSATSGDARGIYAKLYFGGAGSGEALRAYGTAAAANVATGGTANGAHISFDIAADATISGQANAIRATLGAAAQSRTISGNLTPLMLESDIATGNTVPATVAFMRVVDTGAVAIANLLRLPAPSNGTIFATHTSQTNTHSIKIVTDAGVTYYIPCHATATGRG